jgi:hypothetical protein
MNIILDNSQTEGGGHNDDKIREWRAYRERRERSKPERQQQQINNADDDTY